MELTKSFFQTALLLGSNLGAREKYLDQACTLISQLAGKITAISPVYRSESWGIKNNPEYLNAVVVLETVHTPFQLLEELLKIESQMGRIRNSKWENRIIDIDILYYGDFNILSENLTIPHPEIQNRRFVLMPLCDIIPEFIHPVFKVSNMKLLSRCNDSGKVTKSEFQLSQASNAFLPNTYSIENTI